MASHSPACGAFWVLAVCLSGCAVTSQTLPPAERFGRDATLIYVPGIGGCGKADRAWASGLREGGYDGVIETCDWSRGLGPISALWAHDRQRAFARQLADQICKLREQSPASPITLAGHSAGAGVVVYALEDLPLGVKVDNLLLLAPALSKSYDLTRALRHVRRRADAFCSGRDTMVLAVGTFLFGTVDGVHGEAAGHGGFVRPPQASAVQYAKLRMHFYSGLRRSLGDDGGHYGPESPVLAAELIARLLPRSAETIRSPTADAGVASGAERPHEP